MTERREPPGRRIAGNGHAGATAPRRAPDRPRAARAIRLVDVIACGSPDRGDDGVAEAAMMALPADIRAMSRVHPSHELSADDLLDIPAGGACVVVDAAAGPPPGGLVIMPLRTVAARAIAQAVAPRSSHELPIDQVLRLVEVLRGDLPEGTFLGMGGLRFGLGRGLSAPVRAALPALVDALGGEIRRLASQPEPDARSHRPAPSPHRPPPAVGLGPRRSA